MKCTFNTGGLLFRRPGYDRATTLLTWLCPRQNFFKFFFLKKILKRNKYFPPFSSPKIPKHPPKQSQVSPSRPKSLSLKQRPLYIGHCTPLTTHLPPHAAAREHHASKKGFCCFNEGAACGIH
jgi:hypothetical protein